MAKRVVDESSLTSVADAIRSKKGTTAPLVFPEGFRTAIESIAAGSNTEIGGSVTDTSDATATEYDIEKGKTAYVNGKKITGKHECEEGLDTSDATATENDLLKGATAYVNGEKITGMHECDVFTLPALTAPGSANDLVSGKQLIDANGNVVTGELLEKASFYKTGAAVSYEPAIKDFTLMTKTDSDMVLRAGKYITLYADGSNFGDAAAADVAKGKTFTSQNGLKVVGIREDDGEGGIELPKIDPSVLGTADDLAEGKQFIDAAGNVVTGNVRTVDSGVKYLDENARIKKVTSGDKVLLGTEHVIQYPRLFRSGSNITLLAPAENFGDATAADVAAGKTFTSAAGHKVVGTMAPGGGFTVTDDGAGNVTITSSAITDNNGNVVIA